MLTFILRLGGSILIALAVLYFMGNTVEKYAMHRYDSEEKVNQIVGAFVLFYIGSLLVIASVLL